MSIFKLVLFSIVTGRKAWSVFSGVWWEVAKTA